MRRTVPAALAVCGLLAACTAPGKSGGLDPAATLVSLELNPAAATVAAGDSANFSVTGHMSDGSTAPFVPVWQVSGGTITTQGRFHAGATPGSYKVIARTGDLSLADTSLVTVVGGGTTLTAVTITPASATVAAGGTVGFAVTGSFSDGSTGPVAVTWSATGGTIGTNGTYQAGATPGSYRAIAAAAGGKADTAQISVTPAPVVLTSVVVTPAAVTLDPGATASFTATGHYSDGSTATIAAGWTATGGSVSAAGVYQAGPAAGTYRVIGASAPYADTAVVTINDTSSTPGPTPTVLFSEGWEDASVAGRGWYDNTTPAITGAEHAPGSSGSAALEMAFAAGANKPVKGGALRHKFAGSDRVYLRYWVKYSSNWIGSGVNFHPHEFHFVTDVDPDYIGPSTTHLTTYVEQVYQNGGVPRLALTDALNIDVNNLNVDLTNVTEQRAVAGCNGNSDGHPTNCYSDPPGWNNEKGWRAAQPAFLPNPGTGYKGDWHKVEAYFQLNTIQGGKGVNDGVAQYWFDGQLLIDHHDVLFRTGAHPTMKFNQFLIAPWIGVGSPVAQTMWIDDVVVATGKVP